MASVSVAKKGGPWAKIIEYKVLPLQLNYLCVYVYIVASTPTDGTHVDQGN